MDSITIKVDKIVQTDHYEDFDVDGTITTDGFRHDHSTETNPNVNNYFFFVKNNIYNCYATNNFYSQPQPQEEEIRIQHSKQIIWNQSAEPAEYHDSTERGVVLPILRHDFL